MREKQVQFTGASYKSQTHFPNLIELAGLLYMPHAVSCLQGYLFHGVSLLLKINARRGAVRCATTRSTSQTFGQPLSHTHPHLVGKNECTIAGEMLTL
jgi:hypothetical protein